MGAIPLLLLFAFFIAVENAIIMRKFAGTSPLATQPFYGLCVLIVCGLCWPFRNQLGMAIKSPPSPVVPWLALGGAAVSLCILGFSLYSARAGQPAPDETITPLNKLAWIAIAGVVFAAGAIAYFLSYNYGATPQLAVTTLAIGVPVSTALIMSVLERKPPTMNTLGSIVLVAAAVMLLRRDLPGDAAPNAPPTLPAAAGSPSSR